MKNTYSFKLTGFIEPEIDIEETEAPISSSPTKITSSPTKITNAPIITIVPTKVITNTPTLYPSLKTTVPTKKEIIITDSPTSNLFLNTTSPTKSMFMITDAPSSHSSESPSSKKILVESVNFTEVPFLTIDSPSSNTTLTPSSSATVKNFSDESIDTDIGIDINKIIAEKVLSKILTKSPSKKPTSTPTMAPTFNIGRSCSLQKVEYQLRLNWEEGMSWQETDEEWVWCAECEDECKEDELVQIRPCDNDEEKQEFVFYNCTIRPKRDEDLCFTAKSNSNNVDGSLSGAIRLQECNNEAFETRQLLRIFDPADMFQKFQIKPFYDDQLCLTQEHHPRNREELKFSSCKVAYNNDPGVDDDTSHWIIGSFNA